MAYYHAGKISEIKDFINAVDLERMCKLYKDDQETLEDLSNIYKTELCRDVNNISYCLIKPLSLSFN